jgi:hypothetical protein
MNETLHHTTMAFIPKIAIVDNNTLAVIGLKTMLQNVMPTIEIDTFNSYEHYKWMTWIVSSIIS